LKDYQDKHQSNRDFPARFDRYDPPATY
jgi:hypothetical protein